MCTSSVSQSQKSEPDGGEETITLTISQLEDLIESAIPSTSQLVAGLSASTEPGADILWEKCGPCIAGYKACVKCSWTSCKVRARRC